jgi:hypothetical protein
MALITIWVHPLGPGVWVNEALGGATVRFGVSVTAALI